MQSIEEHEEYCNVCKGFHNPLYSCVAKKLPNIDHILKDLRRNIRIKSLITSVKVGEYGK